MNINERFKDYEYTDNAIKGYIGEYRWLSNFHPCIINMFGYTFNSIENAYQAAKCDDPYEYDAFVGISAAKAKNLGRKVKIRPDWERVKVDVMRVCLEQKFSDRNPELKQKLIETGDKYLEETNYWGDKFWGVYKGVGQNMLGELQMEIRTKLLNKN
jgi:ribA/ribD-fused uncharacterized protein